MRLPLIMGCVSALLLYLAHQGYAMDVTLVWDPVAATGLAGYKLYYQQGTDSSRFSAPGAASGPSPVAVGKVTTTTLSGLDTDKNYLFAVTACTDDGFESVYSNMVALYEKVPPEVSITSPQSGALVSGIFPVSVNAADSSGVSSIEVYANNLLLGTSHEARYSHYWDTFSLPPGSYTISAKAFDSMGNMRESTIPVTLIRDTTAPTVLLRSPAPGSTAGGTVLVEAEVTDNVAISRVEFYINDVLRMVSNSPPFSYNWYTRATGDGVYTLMAKAYDTSGNVGRSSDVTMTVRNAQPPPSVSEVPLLEVSEGRMLDGSVELVATDASSAGTSFVEFYLNGYLYRTVAAAPYSIQLDFMDIPSGPSSISARIYSN